jgi:CDP-6-deoxy-D-xylo-4-hexulose-3-dehydrase
MIRVRTGDIRITKEQRAAVIEVLDSGRLTEGLKVSEFERLWAKYIGGRHCVAVNSGTSALILGLYTLIYDERFKKVKKGAKVITSPVTYTATSNAIVIAGLEPVFVDIDPNTFTLIPEQIEELLKNGNPDEYAMILPVHLMGYPNDMDAINDIAKRYDLVVFEDSSQAHGSMYKGRRVGSLSLLSSYSFYIAHNIQVGEMGALITSDERIKSVAKQLKANGRVCSCPVCVRAKGACPHKSAELDPRFTHEYIGFNFKTIEFQAAMAIPQVNIADEIIKKRQENVSYLNSRLEPFKDLLLLPPFSSDVSYLGYPLQIKDKAVDTMAFIQGLAREGVEARPLFGCLPTQQPAFKYLKKEYAGRLPNAEFVGDRGIYVGCHQYLEKEDLDFLADVIGKLITEFISSVPPKSLD